MAEVVMEGAVGLGEIWCHKEKELAVYYGCWAGGPGTGFWGQGAPVLQVLWLDSITSWFGGIRVPGLFCIAPQLLRGPLVRELRSWGALFPPFHLLRSWILAGSLLEPPAELSGGRLMVGRLDLDPKRD